MKRFLFFLLAGLLCFFRLSASSDQLEDVLLARSAVLMDFDNGRILYDRDGDTPIPPASMAKVMTLYLAYDALTAGQFQKNQIITIDSVGSAFSRPQGSSLMLLEEGQEVSFLDLMKGLAVASGNDAAYALADLIGPGVDVFVEKMNRKAKDLGLENTVFVDPDGWGELNFVTAEEYAGLARSYISTYPEALTELHSIPFMVYPLPENMPEGLEYRIRTPRKKTNTNKLLGHYEGIDGLKTGYIDESGFNFTGTANRNGNRLIAVIMGVHTDTYLEGIARRAEESALLLDYGFKNFEDQNLKLPDLPDLRVWMGSRKTLTPQVPEIGEALLAADESSNVYYLVSLSEHLTAPLQADQKIGSVRYYLGGALLDEVPVLAGTDIPEGNLFQKVRDKILLKWREWRGQP